MLAPQTILKNSLWVIIWETEGTVQLKAINQQAKDINLNKKKFNKLFEENAE